MSKMTVKMFGDFTITYHGVTVSDSDNRSKKLWLLLAYLLYSRNRLLKQNELIELLWSENERGANPTGALKTLFYRLRCELDKLFDGAGKQLIVSRNNGYIWNNAFEVELDCESFDELGKVISERGDDAIEETVEMLRLHGGEYLSRLKDEFWVMPIATYYHNEYIMHCLRIFPILLDTGRFEDVIEFCKTAAAIEPFHDGIAGYYMRAYIGMGKQDRAVEIYQKYSDRLLSELGIIPSDEIREIYREAIKSNNDHALTVDTLRGQLTEDSTSTGALVCEYDFFRILYFSMARSVMRSGIAVHLVLLTIHGKRGAELETKKREKFMANLEDTIRHSLRRGDSAARCSASQYVIMLPRANYENSCMVCERILKAYNKNYSYPDAEFRYEVFPIQPDEKESFQWMNR